jgi:hypothetical protein
VDGGERSDRRVGWQPGPGCQPFCRVSGRTLPVKATDGVTELMAMSDSVVVVSVSWLRSASQSIE